MGISKTYKKGTNAYKKFILHEEGRPGHIGCNKVKTNCANFCGKREEFLTFKRCFYHFSYENTLISGSEHKNNQKVL